MISRAMRNLLNELKDVEATLARFDEKTEMSTQELGIEVNKTLLAESCERGNFETLRGGLRAQMGKCLLRHNEGHLSVIFNKYSEPNGLLLLSGFKQALFELDVAMAEEEMTAVFISFDTDGGGRMLLSSSANVK